jgi:DNA-binding HxlR family transcriptional regulator
MMQDVSRNVRTYDHFCSVARTLELVGERWSLLVVRDLLTGPKRFTDLMDRLGGITPKTLSQRLRELADGGVVVADRQPGRREVWYRLTAAGTELGPVVDGLTGWGLRHAWRQPRSGEQLHVEHLLRVIVRAVEDAGDDHDPALWHFRFPGVDYLVASDGRRWSLASRAPDGQPGVTVVADVDAFVQFAVDPSAGRASELGIELGGDDEEVGRFLRRIHAFATVVDLA